MQWDKKYLVLVVWTGRRDIRQPTSVWLDKNGGSLTVSRRPPPNRGALT